MNLLICMFIFCFFVENFFEICADAYFRIEQIERTSLRVCLLLISFVRSFFQALNGAFGDQ